MNQQKRSRRIFITDFKSQMVNLYLQEKSRTNLTKEYDLTPSSLDRKINQSSKSDSFESQVDHTPEENELIALHNELKQLRMEKDILKQAT
ncbi:hypothetical protein [Snodgrassella sp.]|uniref:hypothetical protein n=1 Tax=Snodgrassella sp. TaxID=2815304 RepID=UPI0025881348|nr:hypothetical protein [Snodgrassella sp.]MCO6527127.1 transposase [Snodgrassella sp.]